MRSKPILYHWDECLGKVWASDDPEPGELPICQSPFDPRAMGRGLSAHEILYCTYIPAYATSGFFTESESITLSDSKQGKLRFGASQVFYVKYENIAMFLILFSWPMVRSFIFYVSSNKKRKVGSVFMKRITWVLGVLLLAVTMVGGFTMQQGASAAEISRTKKAILVVSFGTTYADTRKVTIEAVENKIKATFPDYEVRSAFTSRIIIKKLAERDGIQVDTEKQALEKLKAEGYTEVIVQPLHIEAGDEYEKVSRVVAHYAHSKGFAKIELGRPVLYYTGQEEKADDYTIAIKAIQTQLPKLGKNDAVAMMGHGGPHPSNAAYAALQMKIQDARLSNVFVFTVEGYPTVENVIKKCKEQNIKKVLLMPLMVVAGDHANNDMAGDEEDSFKSQFLAAGFKVDTYLHGLGENTAIQDIYVQHIKDVIEGKNDKHERSKDAPVIPVIE